MVYYLRMHADRHGEPLPLEQVELAAEVFRMLGDATRVRLLWALTHEELSVSELADRLDRAGPSVSQHLAKLRLARLVRTRRDRTQIFYRIDNEHVSRLLHDAIYNAEHLTSDHPDHHSGENAP